MNLFGISKQEKAMKSLIHDTNAAFSTLDNSIKHLENWLHEFHKENRDNVKISPVPYIAIEYMKSRSENLKKSINNYYENFKQDFK